MVKKLNLTILDDYPQYLKEKRSFDESRISTLCSPIIRLITEKGYSTEQFMYESYEKIYEFFTGKPYQTQKGREIRQAINHYQDYLKDKEKLENKE